MQILDIQLSESYPMYICGRKPELNVVLTVFMTII